MIRLVLVALLGALTALAPAHGASRIKDIAAIHGMRDNQLVGYGLVIGLQGTGDSLRNSPYTAESLRSMLERLGINFTHAAPRSRNIAAVLVTATLPMFIGKGGRIDVTVSSLGDATSLAGGQLVLTPLYGADGAVYAVAQGPLAVTGFAREGEAESLSQGVPTTGRVPNGAIVEREIVGDFDSLPEITLKLRNPDFNTVIDVTDAINAYTSKRYGAALAREVDSRTVRLVRPKELGVTRFVAEIGRLQVLPDAPARVVVDERTGTVVIGHQVKLSTVAATHGNLTIRITETPQISQPEPYSFGETAVEPRTFVQADQGERRLAVIQGPNLQMLVNGLNRIGLKPSGIIAILQAIKTAGALQAELVVQ